MKFLIALFILVQALLGIRAAQAQAIYGANGQYRGYIQTSPSGVTNVYAPNGQNIQSYQTDNGQTNFYSPQGAYQGTSATPINAAPNASINTPRQAPQASSIKGW